LELVLMLAFAWRLLVEGELVQCNP
jgi:hypothetical protein